MNKPNRNDIWGRYKAERYGEPTFNWQLYFDDIEKYCDLLELKRDRAEEHIVRIKNEKQEVENKLDAQYRANDILIEELKKDRPTIKSMQRKLNKALWALHENMGDKGIYIGLGYEELYFPTFDELREWIEEEE